MPAPATRMCHICGRQFGKSSIDIHIPQCLKKYEAAQLQLPPEQRRPAPAAPVLLAPSKGVSDAAYNDAAYQALEANMAECEHCGRTFAPDRLPIHQRSCTAERPARRRPASRAGAAPPSDSPPPNPEPSRPPRPSPSKPKPAKAGRDLSPEAPALDPPPPTDTPPMSARVSEAPRVRAPPTDTPPASARISDAPRVRALETRAERLEGIICAALDELRGLRGDLAALRAE